MSLIMITESMKLMEAKNVTLGAKEKEFVLQYAFQTGSPELTEKLIEELAKEDADFEKIKAKFEQANRKVPDWVEQIENLLVALEMYRIEEEKAIKRIADFLRSNGVEIDEAELLESDTDKVKDMVREAKAAVI